MLPIFADACYWIALLNEQDGLHDIALLLAEEFKLTKKVTTEMVLVEVLNFFGASGPMGRQYAVRLVHELRADETIDVIEQSTEQFWNAVELYNARPDQDWGLVDCASFQLMTAYNIQEALTNDHHFTQAGFTILM